MKFVKRADARVLLRQHWLSTKTPEQLLDICAPSARDWERMRNYEIEDELEREIGGEWVVSEWCPFNGVYCAWKDHCPDAILEALIVECEANPERLRARGINPDARIAYLREPRARGAMVERPLDDPPESANS